jgi:transcriptional regulator with XRE-family HTH domain
VALLAWPPLHVLRITLSCCAAPPQCPNRVTRIHRDHGHTLCCMAGITTPKARALGAELKRARERVPLGQRELERRIGLPSGALSRFESGGRVPRLEDVAVILTALDVPADERERILELARDPGGGHWASIGVPEQPDYLAALLEFESTACRITTVSMNLCHALTQTGDYARAIIGGGRVPADKVATQVAVRLGRSEVLRRRNPVQLDVLIGEPALRSKVGGQTTMLEQLLHLKNLAALDNVDFRVVPIDAGWHPGLVSSFCIYDFVAATSIAGVEAGRAGLLLGEKPDVEAYQSAVQQVRELALSPEMSIETVAREIDRMEK